MFFSRRALISTSDRFWPGKVLNCRSRESANNSVFYDGEKVSRFGPRIVCVAGFFLRRQLFSLKIEFSLRCDLENPDTYPIGPVYESGALALWSGF